MNDILDSKENVLIIGGFNLHVEWENNPYTF